MSCPVCLSRAPLAPLSPCAHALCLRCALSLAAPSCPLCRAPVAAAGAHPLPRLLAARAARDVRELGEVRQVVIVGPAGVGKARLLRRLLEAYGAGGSGGAVGVDEVVLDAAGVAGRYAGNAVVAGERLRFSVLRLPRGEAGYGGRRSGAVLAELVSRRPHFLLMVAAAGRRRSFEALMEWDRVFVGGGGLGRAVWGEAGAPGRFWVLVHGENGKGTGGEGKDGGEGGGRVDLKADVGGAMERLPLEVRPRTTVEMSLRGGNGKGAWWRFFNGGRWGVRELAERALFYAAFYAPIPLEEEGGGAAGSLPTRPCGAGDGVGDGEV